MWLSDEERAAAEQRREAGYKVVDRRSATITRGADNARRARRKPLHKKRAMGILCEQRVPFIAQRIEEMNLKKMRAADQHAVDTEIHRAEIAKLNDQQVARILAGESIDLQLEKRFAQLSDAIHAANRSLAVVVKNADERIDALQADRLACARGVAARHEAEADLLQTGNPDLKRRMHVTRQFLGGRNSDGDTPDDIFRQIIDE